MKVSVIIVIILIAVCSARLINSDNPSVGNSYLSSGGYNYKIGYHGTSVAGSDCHFLARGNNYDNDHAGHTLDGSNFYYSDGDYNESELSSSNTYLATTGYNGNSGPFAGFHGGNTFGNGIQKEFKNMKIIHEQIPWDHNNLLSPYPISQQALRNAQTIHEYKSNGQGIFPINNQKGQQVVKTIKVIYEQQPFSDLTSRDYSDRNLLAKVKIIKVIHEQQPQQIISFPENHHHSHANVEKVKSIHEQQPQQNPSLSALQPVRTVNSDVKIIKVIHEYRAGRGPHSVFSEIYNTPAEEVKSINIFNEKSSGGDYYADIGFFGDDYSLDGNVNIDSSSGTGFDDTFDKLKSLNVMGTLSLNGGVSAKDATNVHNFSGNYGSKSPTNYYLPPIGAW